jgi:4-aminobutyrate aminotransferase-like enzyme
VRLLSVGPWSSFILPRLKIHIFDALQTTQWATPTSPSTKYANPTHNFNTSVGQSKVPKAPLLAVYARPDFVISHGKGSYVWDTDGRKYLDFSSGIAVNALGHADEGILKVCATVLFSTFTGNISAL